MSSAASDVYKRQENRHSDTVTANEAHSVVSLEKGVPDSVAFCSQLE